MKEYRDSEKKSFLTEEEFRRLYTRCRPMFVRIADSYVHNLHVAEDITDESFIRLWEKRDEIITTNYEAYAFRSVINRCIDHLRAETMLNSVRQDIHESRSRMQMYEISSLKSFNPDKIFAAEVKSLFWRCFDRMPAMTRKIFIASRYEGKTYSEIAESTGISLRQVTSHIQYALKMLCSELEDYLQ